MAKKKQTKAAEGKLPKRARLQTMGDVRAFLSKLINDGRQGVYPVENVSKLANACRILMDCIKTQDLDKLAEEVAKLKESFNAQS